MAGPGQLELVGEIRARWRRWTGIIELVASRQEKRYAVDPDEYHALHTGLLRLSRALTSRNDAASPPLFWELEEILAPWVNYDSMLWADHEIVSKLLDRCQAVQGLLDGRPAVRANRISARFVLGLVVAVAVVGVLLAWAGDLVSLPPVGMPRWIQRAARAVGYRGPNGGLVIAGAVFSLIGIVFVWRSARGA